MKFINVFYANNCLPSFQIPFPFIPSNFSPWLGLRITGRTFSVKREVFVYTNSGNSFHYSSFSECSKSIGVFRASIRRAIQKNKPHKYNFFSISPLELYNFENLGFFIKPNLSVQNYNSYTLVPFGSYLTSSIGLGLFSPKVSNMIYIPLYIEGILIGLLLSDAWIQYADLTHLNARLGFKQGMINFSYFWHVFTLLSHYCYSYPHLISNMRNNKQFFGIQFHTRSLPCFTQLHSIFYDNEVKVVPQGIYNLLTPIALAHWIMGDGYKFRKALILCTDSNTIHDVVRLMNVLIIRYRLVCSLRTIRPNQYRIFIYFKSMPLLRFIISPYMHSSMLYKIQ
jgi:hypothetical protein